VLSKTPTDLSYGLRIVYSPTLLKEEEEERRRRKIGHLNSETLLTANHWVSSGLPTDVVPSHWLEAFGGEGGFEAPTVASNNDIQEEVL
jgi:hypothetical protein